ncbi:helix-turn-helix transcriptional regulator [Spirosoma flavus]
MSTAIPNYKLQAFPRHEPHALFYMTRLEKLVQEFHGIDKPHSHTFYLLMWIRQGTGTHTIDFKTYPVRINQLYFLTPGQVHSWELSSDIQGYNLFFEANFFRERFGQRLFQYPFFHSNQHQPLLEVTNDASRLDTLFSYAYDEYEHQQINRAEVFLSFVHLLLETANRLYTQQLTSSDAQLYDRIRQYEELIEQQFMTIREVRHYADQMHLTPNYLNHICKKVLDKSASQLIHERIAIEAKRWLTHTSNSIKEIGFQLAFDDPSYFVRFFKKQTGQTPAEFREELRLHR